MVARSTDDDCDYTFCEEADDRISIDGLPIHEVYKFHAPEDGQVDDTKRVTERALEQVGIRFCFVVPETKSEANERSIQVRQSP